MPILLECVHPTTSVLASQNWVRLWWTFTIRWKWPDGSAQWKMFPEAKSVWIVPGA